MQICAVDADDDALSVTCAAERMSLPISLHGERETENNSERVMDRQRARGTQRKKEREREAETKRQERGRKQYAVVNGKDLIAVFFSNEILD